MQMKRYGYGAVFSILTRLSMQKLFHLIHRFDGNSADGGVGRTMTSTVIRLSMDLDIHSKRSLSGELDGYGKKLSCL